MISGIYSSDKRRLLQICWIIQDPNQLQQVQFSDQIVKQENVQQSDLDILGLELKDYEHQARYNLAVFAKLQFLIKHQLKDKKVAIIIMDNALITEVLKNECQEEGLLLFQHIKYVFNIYEIFQKCFQQPFQLNSLELALSPDEDNLIKNSIQNKLYLRNVYAMKIVIDQIYRSQNSNSISLNELKNYSFDLQQLHNFEIVHKKSEQQQQQGGQYKYTNQQCLEDQQQLQKTGQIQYQNQEQKQSDEQKLENQIFQEQQDPSIQQAHIQVSDGQGIQNQNQYPQQQHQQQQQQNQQQLKEYPPINNQNAIESQDDEELFYIKLRGMPFNVLFSEIRQFIEINDFEHRNVAYLFDQIGLFQGVVVIKLDDSHQVKQIMKKDGKKLGKRFIEVFKCNVSEFKLFKKSHPIDDLRAYHKPDQNLENYIGVVKLRGVPYQCKQEQLQSFFSALNIQKVQFILENERKSGEAFIEFKTRAEALSALQWNNLTIDDRYIEVYLSNLKEYNAYGKENWQCLRKKFLKQKFQKQQEKLKERSRSPRTKHSKNRKRSDSYSDDDKYSHRKKSQQHPAYLYNPPMNYPYQQAPQGYYPGQQPVPYYDPQATYRSYYPPQQQYIQQTDPNVVSNPSQYQQYPLQQQGASSQQQQQNLQQPIYHQPPPQNYQ